jgi:CRISPR-associated protein Csm5
MHGKTTSIHLGIEILTPVQCGSGQELFKDLDYVEKQNQVFVVDQVRSFNEIAKKDVADNNDLNILLRSSNLSDLVEMAGYFGYSLPMFSRSSKVPEKIREHLKDAHNQPYIPGSALKGAIRTALIALHLRSLSDTDFRRLLPNATDSGKDKKGKNADNKLLEHLLGKDPNHDIFRALQVKDARYKTGNLCLVDIRWLNLTGNADKPDAKWRSLAKRQSFSEWHDADGIYAEMLMPKSQASFQLQWDEFLLSDLSRWHGASNDILPSTLENLKTRLNAHATHRLQQEIDFYYAYCKYGKRA